MLSNATAFTLFCGTAAVTLLTAAGAAAFRFEIDAVKT